MNGICESQDSVLNEFEELITISSNINDRIFQELDEICAKCPNENIVINKSILYNLLQERAVLLNRQEHIEKNLPNTIPIRGKLKKEKKSIKMSLSTSGIQGLRKRRNTTFTSRADPRISSNLEELINPDFLEKITIESLPIFPIVTKHNYKIISTIIGPGNSTLPVLTYRNIASAFAVSNYPLVKGRPYREGDPICDRYLVKIYEDQILIAIADGCNWGVLPRKAAKRATKTLASTIETYYTEMNNIRKVGLTLLLGFSKAHEKIVADANEFSPGKTTLSGGLLIKKPLSTLKEHYFVYASLGDCKLFHFSPEQGIFTDLTASNRTNLTNASDAGGNLGGSKYKLGNLQVKYCTVIEGDYIIAMSDGIHDNFDPQANGIPPNELGMKENSWYDVKDIAEGMKKKTAYLEKELFYLLREIPNMNTESIAQVLMKKSTEITQSSRDFMETHPSEKLPDDVKKYPGKLDHASCVCVKVGATPSDYINHTNIVEENEDTIKHQKIRENHLSYRNFNDFKIPITLPSSSSWKTIKSSSSGINRKSFL